MIRLCAGIVFTSLMSDKSDLHFSDLLVSSCIASYISSSGFSASVLRCYPFTIYTFFWHLSFFTVLLFLMCVFGACAVLLQCIVSTPLPSQLECMRLVIIVMSVISYNIVINNKIVIKPKNNNINLIGYWVWESMGLRCTNRAKTNMRIDTPIVAAAI